MSSSQTVSAVTATLRSLLDAGTRDNPAGTIVTARPPDRARGPNGGNQLNVFLYQTSVSAAFRNGEMPGRVRSGESGVPPLPLALHYLLTAYGDNDEDVLAHDVLGRAMSILHDHPILAPEEIRRALGPDVATTPPLLDQTEGIRVTFQPMTLEEMSKLWTTLQTQYRVSAAYQVSVVLIDSLRPSRTPLPVLRQGEDGRGPVATGDLTPPFPALTDVVAPRDGASAELGDMLTLRGHHLAGDTVEVHFHHAALDIRDALAPQDGATAEEVSVQIPSGAAASLAWPAGVYTVSVAVTTTTDGTPVERTTNALPLALAPRIESITPNPVASDSEGSVSLTITFVPELHAGQRAALLLGDREVLPEELPIAPTSTGTLDFVTGGVAAGSYYARLRLAGVDSDVVDHAAVPPRFDDNQRVTVQ